MKKESSFATLVLVFIIWLLIVLGCKNNDLLSNSQQSQNAPSQSGSPTTTGSGLSASEAKITKQEFGDKWPFTVDEGILACKGTSSFGEVTFTANGKTYAVNGAARGTKKYIPADEIWADNPSPLGGPKKDIGPIIERGLKLCR
jgi:hypothetical protein